MVNLKTNDPAAGEVTRLEVLKGYDILDTPPDDSFDRITRLTAKILKAPMAAVTLVDADRIWLKSKFGITETELPREEGLCISAIQGNDIYEIVNAAEDPKVMSSTLVKGSFGLRYYCAVPLRTKEGFNLGTLCVMDTTPRELSASDKEILQDLTDLVMNQIELQLETKTAVQYHYKVLHSTAHNLKNPVSIMPLLADLIMENKDNPAAIDDIAQQIKAAGQRMALSVNSLIDNALEDSNSMHLRLGSINISKLVKGVVQSNQAPARKKGLDLIFETAGNYRIYGDHRRITEVVDNVVSNAIKFSASGKKIFVSLVTQDGKVVLKVKDEGPGLTKDDLKNLFRRFTSLSAEPTGGETSTGLGLYIAKEIVQAHNGYMYAESEGRGKGASFTVELPLAES